MFLYSLWLDSLHLDPVLLLQDVGRFQDQKAGAPRQLSRWVRLREATSSRGSSKPILAKARKYLVDVRSASSLTNRVVSTSRRARSLTTWRLMSKWEII